MLRKAAVRQSFWYYAIINNPLILTNFKKVDDLLLKY